jgi:hypothetical protein
LGVQRLDGDLLHAVTLATAAWALFLVTAADPEAAWLLDAYREQIGRVLAGGGIADGQIYAQLLKREMSSLATIASPVARDPLLREIERFAGDVARRCGPQVIVPQGTASEVEASKRCYPRTLVGGTAVARCFTEAQLRAIGAPKWSTPQLVLKSWADGSRSVYEITRLALYETGAPLTLSYTLGLFEAYAAAGLVAMTHGAGGV